MQHLQQRPVQPGRSEKTKEKDFEFMRAAIVERQVNGRGGPVRRTVDLASLAPSPNQKGFKLSSVAGLCSSQ